MVPLADAASAWTFCGALIVAVGTVGTLLGFLTPFKSEWSEKASILGPVVIGLGTAIAFEPSLASYRKHHENQAYAGFSAVVFIALLLAVSAWRTSHRDQQQRKQRSQ
jgi:uncharacterized membrane protein YbaN (DUF454 family)